MIRGMRLGMCGLWLAAISSAMAPLASAEEWGTLKGRFVVDGSMPEPPPVSVSGQDAAVCGKHKLVKEDVVVNSQGELANVLVYVRENKDKKIDVNPEYEKTAKDPAVLDNKGCRFEPHVLVMRTTQKLVIKNSDPVGHNTNVQLIKNPAFNVMAPADTQVEKSGLSIEETLPIPVACNMHPWMKGILFIRANPYFAVSKPDGSFEIKDLPAGKELTFQFWQEKPGYLKEIKSSSGFATDAKGRATLTLKPGVTDLGDIKVPAKLLQ